MSPIRNGKEPEADLRSKYPKVIELSLIIAIALFIVAFKFLPVWDGPEGMVIEAPDLIEVEEIHITHQHDKPPEPSRPPIFIEVPGEDLLDDLNLFNFELLIDDAVWERRSLREEPDEIIFYSSQNPPQPVGGMQSLYDKIQYPKRAQQRGIQGMVLVVAYIDEYGRVVKTEIEDDPGYGLGEAASQAIEATEFVPARQRDQVVPVRVLIPVHFRLTR